MSHWLTEFDDDGDPEGIVCRCDIDQDHFADGALSDPDTDEYHERIAAARIEAGGEW